MGIGGSLPNGRVSQTRLRNEDAEPQKRPDGRTNGHPGNGRIPRAIPCYLSPGPRRSLLHRNAAKLESKVPVGDHRQACAMAPGIVQRLEQQSPPAYERRTGWAFRSISATPIQFTVRLAFRCDAAGVEPAHTRRRFESDHGPVSFTELFGDKDTLIIYSFMYGPDRAEGCPMCTSQMSSWDGDAKDIEQCGVRNDCKVTDRADPPVRRPTRLA